MTAETEQEARDSFERWKKAMETRGLKVNMEKTKLMITRKKARVKVKTGKWPCSCCGKEVGVNSIECVSCIGWCHKRCSKLKKLNGVSNFQCPKCKTGKEVDVESLMTTSGEIKEVQEFCYLGVVVDCEAGVERAVRAMVAAAWNKWREMVSLLKNRHIPLQIRGSYMRVV